MLKFILLSCWLVLIQGQAYAVSVEWVCPLGSSSASSVEVSLDSNAKLQFVPDILSDSLKRKQSSSEVSACAEVFQKNIVREVSKFKEQECPASKHDFCFTAISYVETKVQEKIKMTLGKKTFGSKARAPELSPEDYLIEKIAKKEISPEKLSQTFTYNQTTFKVSDFDKVVGQNIENVFMSLNRNDAKQYVQNYMAAKSDVLNTTRESPKRTEVLNNLNQMFGYIYGDKGPDELAKMLECKPEDDLKPIEEIIHRVESINKKANCQALDPGEHKVFQQLNTNYYATGDYLLKRKSDGNYQAILNVKFKTGSGKLSTQEMMNRAKGCLETASPFMKGPNGELMELIALTPEEINALPKGQRPKENVISIESPDFGTNAASYAEDVGCATITHEMLHLLGLCDEYEENRAKYGDMWNCRVVTKAPSIMRELSAFDQAVPKTNSCDCGFLPCSSVMKSSNEDIKTLYTRQNALSVIDYRFRAQYCTTKNLPSTRSITDPAKSILLKGNAERSFVVESRGVVSQQGAPQYNIERYDISCTCPADDTECLQKKTTILKQVMNPKSMSSCPNGTKPIDAKISKRVATPQMQNNILTFTSDAQIESLLQPNHFYKILEGTCPGRSAGYQECADFAYKNNKSSSCNVPAKCRDDKYYLGVPQ